MQAECETRTKASLKQKSRTFCHFSSPPCSDAFMLRCRENKVLFYFSYFWVQNSPPPPCFCFFHLTSFYLFLSTVFHLMFFLPSFIYSFTNFFTLILLASLTLGRKIKRMNENEWVRHEKWGDNEKFSLCVLLRASKKWTKNEFLTATAIFSSALQHVKSICFLLLC